MTPIVSIEWGLAIKIEMEVHLQQTAAENN